MASSVPIFRSTKETTNYARLCRLLVDVGSQVLRQKFDSICPQATLNSYLSSPAVHTTLTTLKARRVLKPSQWDKLYPPVVAVSVSSRDFDITLLMVLLRNICGLTPPVTGWDNLPPATDLTPEADIARIKWYRNTVYGHTSQASVDDATFASCWTDIKATLVRLGGATYGPSIDLLENACMDPVIEEHYKNLLNQWKVDEHIKDALSEMVEKLDELKAALPQPAEKSMLSENDPIFVQECQRQLRSHYNTTMSQVRITPWEKDSIVNIEDVYTKLSWWRQVKRPNGATNQEINDYTEVFEGYGRSTSPKRILVYGRTGIGKSTFSQKIAVDWANEKEEVLKRFDVLLVVRLRNALDAQDMPSLIKASDLFAVDGSISAESVYDYVRSHQERVLLVLDGYDEYSANGTLIREIWRGKQLRDCHVLMTTRQLESDELIIPSNVLYEIKGFVHKEQVNDFARRFLDSERELELFVCYLNDENLWSLAEIPLLLLMLCLIWKNRYVKKLPTSKLELHDRFVETLLCHMSLKNPDSPPLNNQNVLHAFSEEITALGKLAFEALLKNSVYVDLENLKLQSDDLADKMIRSGLFQFSKMSSPDTTKTIVFLHKSIQEFLAAKYLMNMLNMKESEIPTIGAGINSFSKALEMKEVLRFLCQWSTEGARAVFNLLRSLGEKECLTECQFSKTPSLDDLSLHQRLLRDLSLECLISCSVSSRRDIYPLFLSATDGVISVNNYNIENVASQHLLQSSPLPNYVFFEHGDFADLVSISQDVDAVVLTCSALKIKACHYLQMCEVSAFQTEHFFLKRKGDRLFLYFTTICRTFRRNYLEMLRDLTSALYESIPRGTRNLAELPEGHCFSLVREIEVFVMWTSEELSYINDMLSFAVSPQEVIIKHIRVENDVVSHINFTENLGRLVLYDLEMSDGDVALLASSIRQAPNMYSLKVSRCPFHGSVRILAASLRHVPLLTYLTLSRVRMDDRECSRLASSLKHVPRLTVLDLSHNPLGKGITDLARQLYRIPDLQHLNIEKTRTGQKEAKALAQELRSVPRLQTIQLGFNPIGKGVGDLVRSLHYLEELLQVDLKDVKLSREEVDAISDAQRGIYITSYHDLQGRPKKKDDWPRFSNLQYNNDDDDDDDDDESFILGGDDDDDDRMLDRR